MIFISRNQKDAKGNHIKPNKNWFDISEAATRKAKEEKKNHNVNRGVYAHNQVKIALEELFKRKCAYCEHPLQRFDWEVEHFRPHGAVQEEPDHPGYYWLAYHFDNLFPSCIWCNQKRNRRQRGVCASAISCVFVRFAVGLGSFIFRELL